MAFSQASADLALSTDVNTDVEGQAETVSSNEAKFFGNLLSAGIKGLGAAGKNLVG